MTKAIDRYPGPPVRVLHVAHDVDVWQAALNLPRARVYALESTLSGDERSRAATLVFERDRRRFATARGLLRIVLSRYVDAEPGEIRFRYGTDGRPSIEAPRGSPVADFNATHASELMLIAVSRRFRVGIDVERLRPVPEAEAIVEDVFSPDEQTAWQALPEPDRTEAFFQTWTRKEAVVKALGFGLAFPLARIDVSYSPVVHDATGTTDHCSHSQTWSLTDIRPGDGYVGALAVAID